MDITQHEAILITTQYLYKYQESHDRVNYKHIFVGDVHGDLLQFILPLIDTGTITLTGKVTSVKQKYTELDIHLPEYSCNKCNSEIYYLGDLVDGWIFSRQVVIMLARIMRECKNVHLCFGNHDATYMVNSDTTDMSKFDKHYGSLRHLGNSYSTLKFYRGKFIDSPDDFLSEYYRPMLLAYKELWKMGEVMHYVVTDIGVLVASHTIITTTALEDLGVEYKEPLKELVSDINKAFKTKDAAYIEKNRLLSNRSDAKRVFPKQIVGHTVGGLYYLPPDKPEVNPVPVRTTEDRIQHCTPTNGIYYIDIGASASDYTSYTSTPDYYYIANGKMNVTDFNGVQLFWWQNVIIVELDHKYSTLSSYYTL